MHKLACTETVCDKFVKYSRNGNITGMEIRNGLAVDSVKVFGFLLPPPRLLASACSPTLYLPPPPPSSPGWCLHYDSRLFFAQIESDRIL